MLERSVHVILISVLSIIVILSNCLCLNIFSSKKIITSVKISKFILKNPLISDHSFVIA